MTQINASKWFRAKDFALYEVRGDGEGEGEGTFDSANIDSAHIKCKEGKLQKKGQI